MTPSELPLSAPEPLNEGHSLLTFDSGVAALDDWLRRRAIANQKNGASRTFVVCRGDRVVGFYALAAGAIASSEAPGRLRRNMPDPIPMMVLGRLAVDRREQGRGLGFALLRDGIERALRIAKEAGIAGMLVHAISEQARQFYLRAGFVESPGNPMILVVPFKGLID